MKLPMSRSMNSMHGRPSRTCYIHSRLKKKASRPRDSGRIALPSRRRVRSWVKIFNEQGSLSANQHIRGWARGDLWVGVAYVESLVEGGLLLVLA